MADYANNKKARFEYEIVETYEAGIVLTGPEVKSIKASKVNINEGWVRVNNGELFLSSVNITTYAAKGYAEHEPLREKKLLLHKEEILRLCAKIDEKGLTVIPLAIYPKNRKIKVLLGLAKGKKLHDKRDDLKRKAENRDLAREHKFK
jgi:SsrA-binding protein